MCRIEKIKSVKNEFIKVLAEIEDNSLYRNLLHDSLIIIFMNIAVDKLFFAENGFDISSKLFTHGRGTAINKLFSMNYWQKISTLHIKQHIIVQEYQAKQCQIFRKHDKSASILSLELYKQPNSRFSCTYY